MKKEPDTERQSGKTRKGRNKGGSFGPGGTCVCTKCSTRIPHEKGIKCTRVKCPECGHVMIREELINPVGAQ